MPGDREVLCVRPFHKSLVDVFPLNTTQPFKAEVMLQGKYRACTGDSLV